MSNETRQFTDEQFKREFFWQEKELEDIKAWCKKHGKVKRYKNRDYYLYDNTIYDQNMDILIPYAENGFLDLFEYFEYFPANE